LIHSHQQAGFTAGTITNDDEFSADFGHGVGCEKVRKEKRVLKEGEMKELGRWFCGC